MAIQLRRDTAANWASNNPIPDEGQPCFAIDTNVLKIGNGVTAYNSLPAIAGSITSIVGITGTLAQFNTAITDADIQPWDSDLAAIAALAPADNDFIQRKSSAWTNRTIAQVKVDLGITGTNSGDQTTIVGITGTLAQFNTAITDADIQPYDADLATIAGLTATTDSFLQSKASAWTTRTIAQVKTDLGLTGTNSGDQTTIVGITGTMAQFNTAITDGDIQPLDSDLTTIAGLTATTDSFLQAKASAWAARTIAQVKTDLGLTGTNSGDQTTIVGITGTLAQFNTAITDADIMPIAGGTFTGDIIVPAEVYGAGWSASLEAPTKKDLYDKIQTLGAGGGGTILGTVGTTDNRLVRADGTGGVTAQGSLISVSDAGTMDLPDNQGYRINGVYVASYTTGDDVMNINQFGGSILALNASTGTKFISPNLYAELNATTFRFDAYSAARVPMRIKLAASQTANAFEIDSSAGSGGDVLKIQADGTIYTRQIRSPGTSSGNRDLYLTTTVSPTYGQIGRVIIGPANTTNGGFGDAGGDCYIDGGRGDTGSGPGGWVVISAGAGGTPNGNGGTLDLWPGPRQGSGTAGKVRVKHPTAGFYGTLDMSLLTADRTFTFPDANTTLGAGGGGGMAIGGAVTGGGVSRVLYEDASQNLAADSKFTYTSGGAGILSTGKLRLFPLSSSDFAWQISQTSNAKFWGVWLEDGAFTGINGSLYWDCTGTNGSVVFAPNGRLGLGIGYAPVLAGLHIKNSSAAILGVLIQLAASQSANALEINTASGSGGDLLKVNANGKMTIKPVAGEYALTLDAATSNTYGVLTFTNIGMNQCWLNSTGLAIFNRGYTHFDGNSVGVFLFQSYPWAPALTINNTDSGNNLLLLEAGVATNVPLRIKLAASHSANALEINSSSGSGGDLFKIDAAGSVNIPSGQSYKVNGVPITGGGGASAPLVLTSPLATDITLTLKGAASQTANLFETRNSANDLLTYITAGGIIKNEQWQLHLMSNGNIIEQFNYANVWQVQDHGSNLYFKANSGYASVNAPSGLTVYPNQAATVPLTVKLAASQSANAFEINSSAGSGGDVLAVTPAGLMYVPSGGGFAQGAGAYRIISQVPTISENSNVVATFSFYGNITLGNASNIVLNSSTGVQIAHGTPTGIGLKLTLPASQTANAVEVNSNAGSGGDIFKVEPDGDVVIPTGKTYKAGTDSMASEAMAAAYAVALG